ncbi:von Willebrand factor type A domain-containing protein [Kribbella kalugense]|uniref:von Willebrand factor type A domain-containing protein n=1 Tax=Kribbella kalugense TaxID=2512221 RepID=A0A4R8A328_9ACTN|nr:von Willebrand factor type A domain-containing protein [Kribbella kalugense]
MGKHSSAVTRGTNNNRRSVYITAVGLLVLSLGAVFVVRSFGSESGADGFLGGNKACDDPTQIQLATTPEMQSSLEAASKSLAAKGGKDGNPCLQFTITAASSAQVARDVAHGSDTRPDLWVPDSSLWVAQADDGQSVPSIAVQSIATSPMVLVGRRTNFGDTSSWLSIMSKTQPILLDPLNTSPGALALLAVQMERQKTSASETAVSQVVVPLAQALGSMPKPYTNPNDLFSRADQDGSTTVVPASEQSFVKYQEDHPDAQLRAVQPSTGTLYLDYPIVVTAKSDTDQAASAAQALAGELLTDSSAQARDQAGFRDTQLSALSGGRGVGDINQLAKPTSEAIDTTLQNWTRLSLLTHSLAVIDVSGSMADKVGGKTRMQLTIEAAMGGLTLFPDSASLGLWTFSTKIGSDGVADYKQLVPIAPLSKRQRGKIVDQLKIQHPIANGGTGLYDTAIASVRAVRASYDQRAVNSVLLFTDGKNDDPGSPTLAQAVNVLKGLQDVGRPVRIIALGMGPEVNIDELSALAGATGGQAYLARNPGDLKNVFIDALQSR